MRCFYAHTMSLKDKCVVHGMLNNGNVTFILLSMWCLALSFPGIANVTLSSISFAKAFYRITHYFFVLCGCNTIFICF